jgi:hypothetical protein
MEYFGTNLMEHGHYRWILTKDGMQKNWKRVNDLPFDPERLTNGLQKGDIIYYQGGGFTVIGVCGSPKDDRPGCQSVLWEKELLSREEMIDRIKAMPAAWSIINAMPFQVTLK